ncbi:hypothetical protein PZ895_10860 [Mesorhizobium sp. YIM 152430]|uniref:hypothetical protein n=1 Tax=Mesorhizobium sp. YIM 152430 TaxID=3031761 RepID=UPI0023DC5C07|nr:hypothetical protein [Mesorhizobium sp. YIM 152430]MDF1600263.1 hypothetical protein [Mesorhizobium sp. YIM 152430]
MPPTVVRTLKPPPPGWGGDHLTQYLDTYRHNQFATFHNHPTVKKIVRLDDMFFRILDRSINPRPMLPMTFMLRAHSAWRAAAGAAMAGQVYETNATLRASIEISAYGVYIGDNVPLYELWMGRHDTATGKEKVRNEFRPRKIVRHLETMSKPIAADYEALYEETIDQGAHPNERGFSFSMKMKEGEDRKEIEQVYLHEGGLQLDLGLENVVRVGMWTLHLFRLVYPAKFELLGISAELSELRANPI